MTVAVLPTDFGPSPDKSWNDRFIRRGLQRARISGGSASVDQGNFMTLDGWVVASGTWTAVTTARGGAISNNGTTAGSLVRKSATPGNNQFCRADQAFYVAGTMKIGAGALASGQYSTLAIGNPGTGNGFNIGADRGNISVTKMGAYAYDGTVAAVASTVSIDGNWHYIELWYDGANYWFAIDNEAPLQMTLHLPPGSTIMALFTQTQPNGVAADLQFNSWVMLAGKEV